MALCTWNGAAWIEQQLESILAQTCPVHEIVIFDDKSSDNTVDLIKGILEKSPICHSLTVNEANQGSIKNFELAIKACSGDVIFLADQDDYWVPDKVEAVMGVFDAHPGIGWVFSDLALTNEKLQLSSMTMWRKIKFAGKSQKKFQAGKQLEVLLRRPVVTGAALAVKRDQMESCYPFSTHWTHDQWIAQMLAALGVSGIALDRQLVHYRIHAKQQIGSREAGIVAQVRKVRSLKENHYAQEAAELKMMAARVGLQWEPGARMLLEKANHLDARLRIWQAPLYQRCFMVFREYFSGRYRYSWSSIAPLRDLIW